MEDNIRSELWKRGNTFEAFSVFLDESTGIDDTAQLAIIIRGVHLQFNVTEELLKLAEVKSTTRGEDIFNE